MMPFVFKKDNGKSSADYKALLERKLCLARENPEPVFDLSECKLKSVPNSIYSLCKVFRKEALYLQGNQLSSLSGGGLLSDLILLKILDISSNKFMKLSNDICTLKNLEVLNVSKNQLQDLPINLGELKNLIHLDVSNNDLKNLPDSLGFCKNLQVLNIEYNIKLKTLPKSLGHISCLSQLVMTPDFKYPPKEICVQGVHAVMEFLANECGDELVPTSTSNLEKRDCPTVDFNALQETLKQLEKLKDIKQRERLALEEQLVNENLKEVKLQQIVRNRKVQLVEDIKNNQFLLEAEIGRIQEKKEAERALLIKECYDAEEKASKTVKKLLENNQSFREKVSSLSERDRKIEEQLLANFQSTRSLEQKNVLDSMNDLMKEEIQNADRFRNYRTKRMRAAQLMMTEESIRSQKLQSLVKESDKTELIDSIRRDEDLQKTAVATLLERSDTKSWELTKQVGMIQSQLAELTQLELNRKRLEVDDHLIELSKDRIALTNILMDLFSQQSERRKQLTESLRKMEGFRSSEEDTGSFWFEQYQRLLDSKSHQLVEGLKSLNPDLVNEFFVCGVFHYLPLLAEILKDNKNIEYLTSESLTQCGVESEDDQAVILKAIKGFLDKSKSNINIEVPSAPKEIVPSAPCLTPSTSFTEANELIPVRHVTEDCVICLDAQSDVIFYPCGHMCCCSKCFVTVSQCPLCRTVIEEVFEAHF